MKSKPAMLKKYIPLGENPLRKSTHLRVAVFYSLGREGEPRGYSLSVQPVSIEDGWEKCTLYSGYRMFLAAVARASRKVEEQLCLQVVKDLEAKEGDAWLLVERATQEAK
jgi:hypothetical protein